MKPKAAFSPRIQLRPRRCDEVLDLAFFYVSTHLGEVGGPMLKLWLLPLLLFSLLFFGFGLTYDYALWGLIFGAFSERIFVAWSGGHLLGQPRPFAEIMRQFLLNPGALLVMGIEISPWILTLIATHEPQVIVLALVAWTGVPLFHLFWAFEPEVRFLENPGKGRLRPRLKQLREGGSHATCVLFTGFLVRLGAIAWVFASFSVFQGLLGLPELEFGSDIARFLAGAAFLLAGPFLGLFHLLGYIQTRTECEGWDIQMRFKALVREDEAHRRFDA